MAHPSFSVPFLVRGTADCSAKLRPELQAWARRRSWFRLKARQLGVFSRHIELQAQCTCASPAPFARTTTATRSPAASRPAKRSNSHSCNAGNQAGTSFISVKRAVAASSGAPAEQLSGLHRVFNTDRQHRRAQGFFYGHAVQRCRACWHSRGVFGTGRTSQLEDKQLSDPQQVAFSPRVPPPGLWVWLYYKDWLPFTFYGALAVLAFADISACWRARIWVWLHRREASRG
jgi:hypothetical protein